MGGTLPARWVDRLFERLQALYGARFSALRNGSAPPTWKTTWGVGLSGYTAEELLRGLDACKTRPTPPTLPEFRSLCRSVLENHGNSSGAGNMETCYREAPSQHANNASSKNLLWAERIFERHAQGEYNIEVGLRAAEAVLGRPRPKVLRASEPTAPGVANAPGFIPLEREGTVSAKRRNSDHRVHKITNVRYNSSSTA